MKKNQIKKIVFYLFLILFIVFAYFCFKNSCYLKDTTHKNKKYKPFDEDKITVDLETPGKPLVISNRAIILLEKNESLKNIENKLTKIDGITIVDKNEIINLIEIEFNSKEVLKKIKNIKGIEDVSLERVIKKNIKTNDPIIYNEKYNWYLKDVNIFKAWDISMGSPKTVIAVIDGSFDLNHEELKKKSIIKPYNATLRINRLIEKRAKYKLHGTHVASLALGEGNNNKGIVGLCPKCVLMPIELQRGDDKEYYSESAIVNGIYYAIDNGADVINLSLGSSYGIDFKKLPYSKKVELRNKIKKKLKHISSFKRVYEYAKSKNVIIVFAAGNEDMFVDIDSAKLTKDDIIIVSAIDKNNIKASFSNFGDNIDVSAPGVKIKSAVPNNRYIALNGTSMSAPIVSGIIGLMKSIKPDINITEIKDILKKSSKNVKFPKNEPIGKLIDAQKALELVLKLKKCNINEKNTHSKNKKLNFYGLWKSSYISGLYNNSNKPIEIYYYISDKKSFREIKENNNSCKGNIKVNIKKDDNLVINCNTAFCKYNNKAYAPTKVKCKIIKNNIFKCISKDKIYNKTSEFQLIKIE